MVYEGSATGYISQARGMRVQPALPYGGQQLCQHTLLCVCGTHAATSQQICLGHRVDSIGVPPCLHAFPVVSSGY